MTNKRYQLLITPESITLANLECGMSETVHADVKTIDLIEHVAMLAKKGLLDFEDFKRN